MKYHNVIDGKIPCESADAQHSWNVKEIRHHLEDWLDTLYNKDLLWYLRAESPEPLDPNNPVVDIYLSHYRNREGLRGIVKVWIETVSGEVLWSGFMKNGHVYGRVEPEMATHPGWHSRITLTLGEDMHYAPILSSFGVSHTILSANYFFFLRMP